MRQAIQSKNLDVEQLSQVSIAVLADRDPDRILKIFTVSNRSLSLDRPPWGIWLFPMVIQRSG